MNPCSSTVILDVDMGNTRVKWRLFADGEYHFGFFQYQQEGLAGIEQITVAPQRIRVSCVAGQQLLQFSDFCRSHWQVEPEIAEAQEVCAGVTQAYAQRERLGVDRWLGMIAAFQSVGGCVLVSCGSAVTVDVLTNDGQHQGGYIVPGLRLMRQSLFSGTDAVKVEAMNHIEDLSPGKDTESAVHKGMLVMVKGLIDQGCDIYQSKTGDRPKILITGGDGEIVQQFLSGETIYNPYLVLDGLALALP